MSSEELNTLHFQRVGQLHASEVRFMSAKAMFSAGLAFCLLLTHSSPIRAEEPLVEKVKTSIDRGINFLKKKQEDRGGGAWNWENTELSFAFPGGPTCLATLALLTSGVKPRDPVIQRALPFIRELKPKHTYVVALQTMVLSEIGQPKDLNIINDNVQWLLRTRIYHDKNLEGWSYKQEGQTRADNSNTQYALLGLYYGRTAGIKIPKKDWEEIQEFYRRSQDSGGGWTYGLSEVGVRHTMTVAGVCGWLISGLEANPSQQGLDEKTGVAANCGVYKDDEVFTKGMEWLAKRFHFEEPGTSFYNVYGIERVGRLSGQRFIGDHDWYREGCELLTGMKRSPLNQKEDGSWRLSGIVDGTPSIATSFALLFLSKGRTPVLISKLAYNGRPGNAPINPKSWNNKHNDARHLVEYASKELFKKQPVGWQIFDPRLTPLETDADVKEELSNLLASPILYLNGHDAPELTDRQIELLRRYVDEGGFIFAEDCCGKPGFAKGFRELVDKIFKKESPLTELLPGHPIWTAHTPIDLNEFYRGQPEKNRVQCVERGCKTVLVFSPIPLAGYWEEARFMPTKPGWDNRGEMAFRFAGNVIAYATGLEMPKPKGTRVEINDNVVQKNVGRHMLQLVQIRHDGDYKPAPAAMRNLTAYLRDKMKLDVTVPRDEKTGADEDVTMGSAALFQYKVMYIHGRRAFTWEDQYLKNMRENLSSGGLLFGDACCGTHDFDNAFREFVKKLYPDKKLERIPLDDELFSEKLNGKAITTVRCRTEKADGSAEAEYQEVQPMLEGIKVNNRWVVIYSKYDLGCALEKHKSSACKGHDYESALRLASACVLYGLKR